MKYFLSSYIDQNFKTFLRDTKRQFEKFKRNMIFRPLPSIHFNYKLLGTDLSEETLQSIESNIHTYFTSKSIHKFKLDVTNIQLGNKFKKRPQTLKFRINHNPGFNEFSRLLHKLSINASTEVIKKKDNPALIGIIKFATIKPNTSQDQKKQINKIISNLPKPPDLEINNISILHTFTKKNKIIFKNDNQIIF